MDDCDELIMPFSCIHHATNIMKYHNFTYRLPVWPLGELVVFILCLRSMLELTQALSHCGQLGRCRANTNNVGVGGRLAHSECPMHSANRVQAAAIGPEVSHFPDPISRI